MPLSVEREANSHRMHLPEGALGSYMPPPRAGQVTAAERRTYVLVVLSMAAVFVVGLFTGALLTRGYPATCAEVGVKGYPVTMCWRDDIVRPELAEE